MALKKAVVVTYKKLAPVALRRSLLYGKYGQKFISFANHDLPRGFISFFAKKFYNPKPQTINIFVGFDDEGTLWLNGKKIISGKSWFPMHSVAVKLNKGYYVLTAMVKNDKRESGLVLITNKKIVSDDSWLVSDQPIDWHTVLKSSITTAPPKQLSTNSPRTRIVFRYKGGTYPLLQNGLIITTDGKSTKLATYSDKTVRSTETGTIAGKWTTNGILTDPKGTQIGTWVNTTKTTGGGTPAGNVTWQNVNTWGTPAGNAIQNPPVVQKTFMEKYWWIIPLGAVGVIFLMRYMNE